MATNLVTPDEKPDVLTDDHVAPIEYDSPSNAAAIVRKNIEAVDAGLDVQLKSELDRLSILQTVWTFRKTVLICTIAGFSSITDGYQNSLSGSIIANKGFIANLVKDADPVATANRTKLDPAWVSTFGGLGACGMVVGQFCNQWFSDWLGRRAALWVSLTFLLAGVITETFTSVWWHWTLAKFLIGIGYGSFQASIPVYINEQAVPRIRGIVVVAYSLWANLGSLIASLALYVGNANDPYNWRMPILTQYGMLGLCAIMYLLLPESPWWLVSKGKVDKARKSLELKLKGVPGIDIDQELGIIAASIEKQRQWDREANLEGEWAMLKGLNLKRFLIGSWPKVLQQFIGLTVFANYQAYFFQLAGNKNAFQVTLITACVGLLAVILDALLVDKIGRRPMTLFGFGGAVLGVIMIAIVGCFDYTTPQLGSVLVFAGVFANFCNTFQASTSYAYLTEMPQLRFRARATGWGLAWCNLWSVLFSFTVPLMLKVWAVKAIWLFVCTGVPGYILAYFIMPESVRRSPAEIEEMFVDRVPLRRWKGYKTSVEKDLDHRMGLVDA